MDLRVLALVVVLLLAGCVGGSGSDVTPTPSPGAPPQPEQVLMQEIDACPGGSPPAQTSATTGKFEVKPGYDELLIAFHASGEGQGGAEIRWVEEGTVVWSRPSSTQINSAPTVCGGHAHAGGGETVKVEPGNYTTRLSYAGVVAIHFEVIARSSHAETDANHTHAAP